MRHFCSLLPQRSFAAAAAAATKSGLQLSLWHNSAAASSTSQQAWHQVLLIFQLHKGSRISYKNPGWLVDIIQLKIILLTVYHVQCSSCHDANIFCWKMQYALCNLFCPHFFMMGILETASRTHFQISKQIQNEYLRRFCVQCHSLHFPWRQSKTNLAALWVSQQ